MSGSYDSIVYCLVCGETLSSEHIIVPALKHSFTKYVSNNDATCTQDGTKTAYCDDDDCLESNTIVDVGSATGHSPAAAVKENIEEATCNEAGGYDNVVYCKNCEAELSRTHIVIKARGHSFTNYVSDNNATCTENGTMTAVCDNGCDETDTRVKADTALGHTEVVDEAKAATCTETGLTEGKHCSVCGTVITEQTTVAALGHSYGKTPKYTWSADGKTCTAKFTCSRCKITKTVKGTVTGNVKTAATYVAKGTTTYTATFSFGGKTYTSTKDVADISAKIKTNLSTATVTLSYTSKVYTGSALKPTVTVKIGKTKIASTYYTVSYSKNKNPGLATVTVTAKSGNIPYTGSKKATFKILPKTVAISSLTNSASKTLLVKWGKNTTATGYEIQYSTSSKFKSAKTGTVSKNSTISTKLTKLTKGKTYYVRIRTYKTVSKVKYYSAWSASKKLKVSK